LHHARFLKKYCVYKNAGRKFSFADYCVNCFQLLDQKFMSNQVQHCSRLSKLLWNHLELLTKETLAKLFVALFFENGFDFEADSIIRNCMELENTWYGLKNHITPLSVQEEEENLWLDKKCQIEFLMTNIKKLSETFCGSYNSRNVENLRGCLLLLKSSLQKVRCN
jgi:hypothetical protein